MNEYRHTPVSTISSGSSSPFEQANTRLARLVHSLSLDVHVYFTFHQVLWLCRAKAAPLLVRRTSDRVSIYTHACNSQHASPGFACGYICLQLFRRNFCVPVAASFRVGGVARVPKLLAQSFFAVILGPMVLRTVLNAGVGGDGGNGGTAHQQSDTNQHGHGNSGKPVHLHLLTAYTVI